MGISFAKPKISKYPSLKMLAHDGKMCLTDVLDTERRIKVSPINTKPKKQNLLNHGRLKFKLYTMFFNKRIVKETRFGACCILNDF